MSDLISRQAAIDLLKQMRKDGDMIPWEGKDVFARIRKLPPAQPEIVRCKDCKYWHSGSCEYPEHVVNSQDYYVGDIETEAEHFCGYAERREVTT